MAYPFIRDAACVTASKEALPQPSEDDLDVIRREVQSTYDTALTGSSPEADSAWVAAVSRAEDALADHCRVALENALAERQAGIPPDMSLGELASRVVDRVSELTGVDAPWDDANELLADSAFRKCVMVHALMGRHSIADVERELPDMARKLVERTPVERRSDERDAGAAMPPAASPRTMDGGAPQSGFAPPIRQ